MARDGVHRRAGPAAEHMDFSVEYGDAQMIARYR